ncbi:MAG: hypothetical protein ACI857_003419 [Arenicella sp.]|jgi:hypothetical protein
MRSFLLLSLILFANISKAQLDSLKEYKFSSTDFYNGEKVNLKERIIQESYSEIQVNLSDTSNQTLTTIVKGETVSYSLKSGTDFRDDFNIWTCKRSDANLGLKRVYYVKEKRWMEFEFADGKTIFFFGVKRIN